MRKSSNYKYDLSCYITRLSPYKMKKGLRNTLEKGGKQDFKLVKSYEVINLLNYIEKVVKKVVVKKLSYYCEDYSKLYLR